jgi:hypothetical protein
MAVFGFKVLSTSIGSQDCSCYGPLQIDPGLLRLDTVYSKSLQDNSEIVRAIAPWTTREGGLHKSAHGFIYC